MKTAVITGRNGQDGTLLAAHLTTLGYQVIGVTRESSPLDLQKTQPHEIYHLAAFHHSSQQKLDDDLDVFLQSNAIHVEMTARLLEDIRRYSPATRFFYAASCHVFGTPPTPVQDEMTPLNPDGLYGITKQAGIKLCHYYRQQHGVFASVGILYNHESALRRSHFVSKKIVEAAVAVSQKRQEKLVLGDLDAEIDWGYAGDYVRAMQQILQLPEPEDFVISSGEKHRVREFVEEAFRLAGLDWKQHVVVDPNLLRAPTKTPYFGDNSKLRRVTGWQPATSFRELVNLMVMAEKNHH